MSREVRRETPVPDASTDLAILVVDDERKTGEYMRVLLETEEHTVLYLDSVDDAIQHALHEV